MSAEHNNHEEPSTGSSRMSKSYASAYPAEARKRQFFEGLALLLALLLALVVTFQIWQHPGRNLEYLILAGVAGIIGGLLHSLKWFYKSIARGFWDWDRVWWRFMNPVVSGVLALSIYVVFRAGTFVGESAPRLAVDKENYYAYGVGFLTGLFADNAMNKLRDIAQTLFGKTKEQ